MAKFDKVPDSDHEAESFDVEGFNDDEHDRSASGSSRNFLTKYSYLSPKVKYGIGIAILVLLGTILIVSGSGGDGGSSDKAYDNSMGAGADADTSGSGSGSGSGTIIDTVPPESHSGHDNDGSTNSNSINAKDPSKWNPTILEWEDINEIVEKLDKKRDAMLFKRKIFEGVTYMQKTFIFMQSNATFEDLNENGEVEAETEMGIAEQYQVEFDDLITITKNPREEKDIEYIVSRLAVTSMNDQGEIIEIDSAEENDDDEVSGFLDDVIGRISTVKLDKYDQILETSDEEEFLEQLQEIAPGMSAMDMYDETSRMAQNLPIRAVSVGDDWLLKMTIKGMEYTGTVKLLGYTTYDGSDCAVFDIDSTLNFETVEEEDTGDEDNLEDGLNGNITDMSMDGEIKIKNGVMTGKMFWDVQHHFPRYSLHEVSLTMEMMDPFDDNEKIEFPSYEVIDMYMAI